MISVEMQNAEREEIVPLEYIGENMWLLELCSQ